MEPGPTPKALAEIERAWEEEILRRAREHEAGRVGSLPWEGVRARIFGVRGDGERDS